VIEKGERQLAVHGLDPEGQPAQLHRQRVQIHAVKTMLHHEPLEPSLELRIEVIVRGAAGQQVLLQEHPADRPLGQRG